MIELTYILIVTFLIALISFIGVFTLSLNDKLLDKILMLLVSLSAGALMGGAFLHLIPKSIETVLHEAEEAGTHAHIPNDIFLYILVGFLLFFIIEKVLHWRHCHKGKCDVHTFHYMNLVGDAIHNFIDGLILSVSFITSIELGFTTSIAIAAHEIPQEIGDFGVLLYGGFNKKKALIVNFLVALTIVLGGITGYLISKSIETASTFLLPFAAGGFIYIAATDLVPEIKKELKIKKYMATLLVFICGILIMWFIKYFFHG